MECEYSKLLGYSETCNIIVLKDSIEEFLSNEKHGFSNYLITLT